MTKKQKNTLVPALRFPEFKNAGTWQDKRIGDIFTFKQGVQCPVEEQSKSKQQGWVRFIRIVDLTKNDEPVRYIKSPGEEHIINETDLFMVRYGTPGVVGYNYNGVIANNLFRIIPRGDIELSTKFYYYVFNNLQSAIISLASSSTMPALNFTTLSKLSIPSLTYSEQQKIADCLSSLDDLIDAENQKLDALKDHKKGLMQQLFPAEGKTVPDLRFPGFEGEWKSMKFGSLCKFIRGPFGGALKKEIFVKEGYAVYEQSHAIYSNYDSFRYYITEDKFKELKRFAVLPGDIIMSCSGTMGKFSIVPKESKKGVINQALLKLTVLNNHDIRFIKETLELPDNLNKLLSQSAGGAIKNVVEVAQIKEIDLLIPELKEQRKIADFLAAVDELTCAQAERIEQLKEHKKGLMQQLFPSV